MATKFSLAVLIFGLAVCSYWAQEKQGSKQEQRPGVTTAAHVAQSPHTYDISSEDNERRAVRRHCRKKRERSSLQANWAR